MFPKLLTISSSVAKIQYVVPREISYVAFHTSRQDICKSLTPNTSIKFLPYAIYDLEDV